MKKYFFNVSCGNADTFVLGLTDRQKISYSLVNTTARKNDCHELWRTTQHLLIFCKNMIILFIIFIPFVCNESNIGLF